MAQTDEKSLIGLAGKVALITGGGAGIGRAIAETFAKFGAKIAIVEIDPERAASARAALPGSIVVEGDAADRGTIRTLIGTIGATHGRLDILVNNVGDYLGYKKPFDSSTEEEWDDLYRVNLLHVFRVTQEALPLIRASKAGGSIINISTIECFRGIPLCAVYSAFKTALTGFTQSLALELGRDNIRVNAIAPETTNSEQIKATPRVPPENRDYIGRWFPIGRFGEGGDTAGAAVFLASDMLSGWVTGTTIHVDGGALAAGAWARLPDGGWTHLPIISVDGYTPRPG
jgi:NAD(P)-dependent dehydrogenase (short-subunit alcohol dehydrogenase family)